MSGKKGRTDDSLPIIPVVQDSSTAFDLTMAAEVENLEPPPTKKPRRQHHFDPSWVQNDADAERGFSYFGRSTLERASLNHSTYSWSG